MNEPELRFKADDGSDFPEWEEKKLGDIFTERNERSKGNEQLLSITIASGVIQQSDSDKRNIASSDTSNYKVVHKRDLAYNTMRMWQGAEGVSDYDGIVSPAYTVLICNEGNDAIFFADMFKLKSMLYQFGIHSQGLTSDTWNLKYKHFSEIHIKTPRLEEQQKIADLFSTLDNVINSVQKEVDSWEQMKRGVMQKLFSQEVRFKTDDGSEFPEWEERLLGEQCISISSGKTKLAVEDGKYILYGSTGEIGKTNNPEISGLHVLVARVGSVGTVSLRSGTYGVSDNTLIIFNKPELSTTFLYYLLINFNLKRLVFGSSQPLITGGQLKKLKLKFPCLTEQQKIADCLSEFDSVIEKTKQKLEAYKQLKKGLMQQMFV